MFGLGFSELLVLGLIALVLIGPEELPRVARVVGRFLNEIKRGSDSLKDEFRDSARRLQDDMKIHSPPPSEKTQPKEDEKKDE